MRTPGWGGPPRRLLGRGPLRAARQHWRPLAASAGLLALVAIPVTLAFTGYGRGLVHGLLVGFATSAACATMWVAGRSAHQWTSAWGEENTRDVLRRMRRRRVVVDWVDGVATSAGDLDHLVLTRGGAVAIDSTWHNPTSASPGQWRRDAAAARESAQRAELILRSEGLPVPVAPVVVIWGAPQGHMGRGLVVDGVRTLSGRHLEDWLADHAASGALGCEEARTVGKALRRFRSRVRAPHVAASPVPVAGA